MKKSICIRHSRTVLGAAALFVSAGGSVYATNSASQNVDIDVTAVNEIALGGAAVTLSVSSAAAGVNPTGVIGSTYSITTNSTTSKKITAQLGGALPAGLTLSANLAAPSTGVSSGAVALSTTPADVVTSIEAVTASGLSISYAATATVAVAPGSNIAAVTYTLVDS